MADSSDEEDEIFSAQQLVTIDTRLRSASYRSPSPPQSPETLGAIDHQDDESVTIGDVLGELPRIHTTPTIKPYRLRSTPQRMARSLSTALDMSDVDMS